MSHDLAIARASRIRPIAEVAESAGIPLDALDFHGRHIAKLERDLGLAGKTPSALPMIVEAMLIVLCVFGYKALRPQA